MTSVTCRSQPCLRRKAIDSCFSLNGWRQQGIQVVDAHTGSILQTISQPSAFFGLAFSHNGQTLYVSGGNEDVVYRYTWREGQATLIDKIVLAQKEPRKDGTRFPAGLAVSHDDKYLFVAENLGDTRPDALRRAQVGTTPRRVEPSKERDGSGIA